MSNDDRRDRDLRFLKAYAYLTTTIVLVLAASAFRQAKPTRFDEIDVQRINVREPDGTLRLTISNHARLPDPVIGGKAYPLRGGSGGRSAGLIFFNDEGNENGGLAWTGRKTADGHYAGANLSFDQFNQDETLTLSYGDENGKRSAGLEVADRGDGPLTPLLDSMMAIRALREGPEKTRRMQALRESMRTSGLGPTERVFVGKDPYRTAKLELSDPKGQVRIALRVDSLGNPLLAFYDAQGKVISQLPQLPPAR